MPNGIVTKERFEGMESTDLKLGILFDTMIKTHEKTDTLCIKIDKLNQGFNKWRKIHTALAVAAGATAGFFGGMFNKV